MWKSESKDRTQIYKTYYLVQLKLRKGCFKDATSQFESINVLQAEKSSKCDIYIIKKMWLMSWVTIEEMTFYWKRYWWAGEG